MTSGSYTADPQTLTATASSFQAQVDPIDQQAQKLTGIKGDKSNTGRDYAAQGTSYHTAVTQTLDKLVREYSEQTSWASGQLSAAGETYESGDTGAANTIASSGSGA